MRPPRGLSPAEADLWARLAATVKPLAGRRIAAAKPAALAPVAAPAIAPAPKRIKGRIPPPRPAPAALPPPALAPLPGPTAGLDSHWERRLARTAVAPDFTLDLHGCTLDMAYQRLDAGLAQARAMDARLVLLITGKARPVEAADRSERRGAIRAKILDWLAAGSHASAIAAIRPAQRRHGGEGAIYVVLKRSR